MNWSKLPRSSKLANVMYSHLASDYTRAEMEELARNAGKPLVHQKLLGPYERGSCSPLGGQAVQPKRSK